jgi:hypothetical protein
MPELNLPNDPPEAAGYLSTIVLSPRDPGRHANLLKAVQNEAVRSFMLRELRPTAPFPPAFARHVYDAATGPRLSDELVKIHARLTVGSGDLPHTRSDLAAIMFLYVLACAEDTASREPATLEHARAVVGTAGKTRAAVPYLSRSNLVRCWRDFSPAVHLIAAMFLRSDLWCGIASKGYTEFLAYAEALRRRGENHRPPHSKTSLLDPAETWQVPRRLPLPDVTLRLPSRSDLKVQMSRWR